MLNYPFQARDRLPSITEEILRIGRDDLYPEQVGSENSVESSLPEGDLATPSEIPVAGHRDREIEDYPRPLSVVGVSVL